MIRDGGSSTGSYQGDLFEDRGGWGAQNIAPQHINEENVKALTDDEIIARIAIAKLSNIEQLCDQVIKRELGDSAVPNLMVLWNRFKGFGITKPLLEQRHTLETLAAIGHGDAKNAINTILMAPDLPDSLLPLALQAAVKVNLYLPFAKVAPWLDHHVTTVRVYAFTLIKSCNPPRTDLERGFSDPDPSVRRAAFITAALLGHTGAKSGLMTEFRKNPNSHIIAALCSIADDDIITQIARYGIQNETYREFIIEELKAMDSKKATALVQTLSENVNKKT